MSLTLTRRLLAIHRICGLIFSLNMLIFSVTGILGLVLALLTEGIGDAIALVLLCLPLLVIGRHVLRRS